MFDAEGFIEIYEPRTLENYAAYRSNPRRGTDRFQTYIELGLVAWQHGIGDPKRFFADALVDPDTDFEIEENSPLDEDSLDLDNFSGGFIDGKVNMLSVVLSGALFESSIQSLVTESQFAKIVEYENSNEHILDISWFELTEVIWVQGLMGRFDCSVWKDLMDDEVFASDVFEIEEFIEHFRHLWDVAIAIRSNEREHCLKAFKKAAQAISAVTAGESIFGDDYNEEIYALLKKEPKGNARNKSWSVSPRIYPKEIYGYFSPPWGARELFLYGQKVDLRLAAAATVAEMKFPGIASELNLGFDLLSLDGVPESDLNERADLVPEPKPWWRVW